jgi:hypothetical protein
VAEPGRGKAFPLFAGVGAELGLGVWGGWERVGAVGTGGVGRVVHTSVAFGCRFGKDHSGRSLTWVLAMLPNGHASKSQCV